MSFNPTMMKTIWFVEAPWAIGGIGNHVHKINLFNRTGPFRIARFDTCFWPSIGRGYYLHVPMKNFIRRWKRRVSDRKQAIREVLEPLVCDDVLYQIIAYAV